MKWNTSKQREAALKEHLKPGIEYLGMGKYISFNDGYFKFDNNGETIQLTELEIVKKTHGNPPE